ncbi:MULTISPECIES: hypothetical protein [unclassified Streptomyces]|uniref:hypothetical protein n=1 Tax=unclassified Streptomyces TaxID=2593676 RepID=UPI00404177FE
MQLQARRRRGAGAVVEATCRTLLHGAVDSVVELRGAAADTGGGMSMSTPPRAGWWPQIFAWDRSTAFAYDWTIT